MATLFVSNSGEIKGIYDETFSSLYSQGNLEIKRASHVEPCVIDSATMWEADMSPSGGPVLGPFLLRSEALAAEVKWLNENILESEKNA